MRHIKINKLFKQMMEDYGKYKIGTMQQHCRA